VQFLLLFVGVGCVRAGDVAGLISVPKLPRLPASLTSEQVRATVDANRGALQRCYDEWLARHPLRGHTMFAVDVSLAIAPDGGSEQMSLRGLDDHAPLARCIEAELSRWRFPHSQLGADVHVPIVLAGRQREDVSPRALHENVIAQRASLAPCFDRIEGSPPPLHANLSIDAEGKPRVVQLRGAERQPTLKTCLRDTLLSWRFPRASKGAEFAFPL
jgi:hypothetical protein